MRNVFHTVYIQKPINKLAGRGMAGRARKRHLDEEEVIESETTCPKYPAQIKATSLSLFPKLAYFRAQYSNAFDRICDAPWIVLVSCKGDGKGLRLASDVGHEFGVNIVECYKTRDDAIKAGMDMKKSWGRKKSGEQSSSAVSAANPPRSES
jgi:hypothetical protein